MFMSKRLFFALFYFRLEGQVQRGVGNGCGGFESPLSSGILRNCKKFPLTPSGPRPRENSAIEGSATTSSGTCGAYTLTHDTFYSALVKTENFDTEEPEIGRDPPALRRAPCLKRPRAQGRPASGTQGATGRTWGESALRSPTGTEEGTGETAGEEHAKGRQVSKQAGE